MPGLLVLAAAAAVAESVRDAGGHALLVADELAGLAHCGTLLATRSHGRCDGAATDQLHLLSSGSSLLYLQRAGQLVQDIGGGSLTILGLMEQASVHAPSASSRTLASAPP